MAKTKRGANWRERLLLRSKRISDKAKLAYRNLRLYRNMKTGLCCPSAERQAEDLKVSIYTIWRCIKELKKTKLIMAVQQKHRDGKFAYSTYDLKLETETGGTLDKLWDYHCGELTEIDLEYEQQPSIPAVANMSDGDENPAGGLNRPETAYRPESEEEPVIAGLTDKQYNNIEENNPSIVDIPQDSHDDDEGIDWAETPCRYCHCKLNTTHEYLAGVHDDCREKYGEDFEPPF